MNLSVFIKTLNLWLSILFGLSVVIVLTMDLWLLDIEAPYKVFVAFGKFNYGVSLSYIAAYIFYLITVHYPETKNAISIYTAASFPAKAIVSNVEYIFIDMGEKLGMNLKRDDLSEEKIKDILCQTKCYNDSTLSKPDLSYSNWLEYLLNKESVIKTFQQKVQPLYPKMDGEYIAALAAVEQDDIIKPVIATINACILFKKSTKDDIHFNNGLETMFIELYKKVKILDTIIDKRNSRYDIKSSSLTAV